MFPRKGYIVDETLHIHRTSGERLKKGADIRERKEECLSRGHRAFQDPDIT